ncbi:MAG TPA: rod shape-determining protein [Patescibacteria group bacterium]|nr:rod shape-determining protein [Patescibacteria group bacterium]
MLGRRIGIDLGTTNTLVYLPKKGIVSNEPTVVALSVDDNRVLAIGKEAKEMIGRTPESIIASHPLRDGVIADYRICEAMLRYFINRVSGGLRLFRPEVMIAAPAGITSTEKRAVIDAALQAGAKAAFIIKEPVAAALGAEVPISSPSGNMIIDIGGGTSEVAVIALGDIVAASSVRTGGRKMDQALANYIRRKHNLIVGEQTAENIKIKIGSVLPLKKELKMEISGSNSISGLPETIIVTSNDVVKSLKNELKDIINTVKNVLQNTPPELAADVIDKGIIMSGGGSMLRNIDSLMTKVTGVPCHVAEEPLLAVAKGTGMAVENLDAYKKSVLWIKS